MEQNAQAFLERMEQQDRKLADALRTAVAKLEAYYPEHQVFALSALDDTLQTRLSKLAKACGCAATEALLRECGFSMISGDAVKALRHSVVYGPGAEPEVIRGKVDSICRRLQEYYPDGQIPAGLEKAHKSLSSDITGVYQWLGYPDRTAFLRAYGYTMEMGQTGRPAQDHMEIIQELKRRYANGPTCKKIEDLKAENPDLAPKFKSLNNKANQLFGMTLAKYLAQEGILLSGKQRINAGQAEYEKLRRRYAEAPFCGTVADIANANDDLNWTDIRNYAQSQGMHLKDLLPRDGILISPKQQVLATVQELAAHYPQLEQRPLFLEELRQDHPSLDLEQLCADIRREFRQKPEEFLAARGVLCQIGALPPSKRLSALAAALHRQYAGKPRPTSAAALQLQNPNISIATLDQLAKRTLGKSSIEFLLEQGLLDLTPDWLFEYENFRYWTMTADDAFDHLREMELTGKQCYVTGQYAAPGDLERTAARLQAMGGVMGNADLQTLDYLVGVHPSPHAWARHLNLNGHSLWVMTASMVDRLQTAGR